MAMSLSLSHQIAQYQGLVPDLIINPHAIPSRMTIGQLIETLMGKLALMTGALCLSLSASLCSFRSDLLCRSLLGTQGVGSPFTEVTVETISCALHRAGYQRRGNEIMYNGHTGQKLDAHIFMGAPLFICVSASPCHVIVFVC